jgi:hypothetical protein
MAAAALERRTADRPQLRLVLDSHDRFGVGFRPHNAGILI